MWSIFEYLFFICIFCGRYRRGDRARNPHTPSAVRFPTDRPGKLGNNSVKFGFIFLAMEHTSETIKKKQQKTR